MACTVVLGTTLHSLYCESCVFGDCGLQGKLATLRELSGYEIWWVTDRTVPKVAFIAISLGETDLLTSLHAQLNNATMKALR